MLPPSQICRGRRLYASSIGVIRLVGGDWGGLWSMRLKLRGKTAGNGERWKSSPARWVGSRGPKGFIPPPGRGTLCATSSARVDTGPAPYFSVRSPAKAMGEYLSARTSQAPFDRNSGDAVSALTSIRVGNGEIGKPLDTGVR